MRMLGDLVLGAGELAVDAAVDAVSGSDEDDDDGGTEDSPW
jgi:hypothetical protein